MNSAHLSLSFRIEKDDTLATMETVFATVRRGGVQLTGLELRSQQADDEVVLGLQAEEPDRLDLFLTRLGNIIGVHDCRVACTRPLALSA